MFLYYIVASWLVTFLVCASIRRMVARYEGRAISSGTCIPPSASAAVRASSVGNTADYFEQSSVTERELNALKKTPVFQLWAESKSRSMTRQQLAQAQRTFWIRGAALVALVVAVSILPFDSTITESLTFSSKSSSSLTGLARRCDQRVSRLSALPPRGVDSILGLGPHEVAWAIAAPFAMLVGGLLLSAMDWDRIKHLVRGTNSLISFMATTDHDPAQLADKMNRMAIGDLDVGRNRKSGTIEIIARFLLVGGLLVTRFGAVAIAYHYQVLPLPTASVVSGSSIGFIVTAVASLAIICQ